MLELFAVGISQVFHPYVLTLLFVGTAVGIVFGCIPGFTIVMGCALALPFTFGMSSIQGLAVMVGIMTGGLAGGQITGILLGIPGTPSSVATCFDGYPMSENGEPGTALATGTWASFFGGIISAVVLAFTMPYLAQMALKFGPWEFFSMIIFGLTIIASLSSKSLAKGVAAGVLGLIAACFGTDPLDGSPRFDFGSSELAGGFSFLPILIGLFAFSQLMKNLEGTNLKKESLRLTRNLSFSSKSVVKNIFRFPGNLLRSSLIGTFFGALPGVGAATANIIAYDQSKKFSKTPEKYGTGITEGLVASESANNGTGGGLLIPTMALGVPGDAIAAVMMGAMILHGIQPGPLLIIEFPDLVYSVFVGYFVANFFMLGLMLYAVSFFVKLTRIPTHILVPVILVMCSIGSFAIQNRFFDMWVLFIFGVLGYFMSKFGFPLAPTILGVILGPVGETNLRRALVSNDDWTLFFTRPISATFLLLSVVSIVYPIYQEMRARKKTAQNLE